MGQCVRVAVERDHAEGLDRADALSEFAHRFLPLPADLIYLDGNSLGRPPASLPDRMAQLVEHDWAHRLIASWDDWIELPQLVGDLVGEGLLGALPGETVIADSTTVNLYKLAVAALDARPDRNGIVVDDDDFPTDRYVVDGLVASRGLRRLAAPDDGTALVVRSLVDYRTGALADMRAVTEDTHRHGAMILWDVSHAVGAVPIGLHWVDADLAVGCTYKYLNGGPGSPAFAWVNERLNGEFRQPIWGWMGQRDVFAMGPSYDPRPGASSTVTGSPTVTALTCVREGAQIVVDAGMGRIREKSIALTSMCIELVQDRLSPLGFGMITPTDPTRRGSHVSITHPMARDVLKRWETAGVIADFREPDVLRLGLSPLTTSFVDVWDAIDRLVAIMRA
jgi:kynureninase